MASGPDPPGSWPAMRPSAMTRMRSESRVISSKSEEMRRMPVPAAASASINP